jgi:hypothetical protein
MYKVVGISLLLPASACANNRVVAVEKTANRVFISLNSFAIAQLVLPLNLHPDSRQSTLSRELKHGRRLTR